MHAAVAKVFNRVLTILFLAGISVSILFWMMGWNTTSAFIEKRSLAPFPKLELSRAAVEAFPQAFDAYFKDRFGLRNRLIRLHNSILVGLGVSPTPRVTLGKQGWLYYQGHEPNKEDPLSDFRGTRPLSETRLDRWRWTLDDQYEWFEEQGIRYLFVLVPGKPTIYPDFMQDRFNQVGPRPIEQARAYLDRHAAAPFLDLTDVLRARKPKDMVFCRTDSHWNDLGAYLGCREIIKTLSKWFPELKPPEESDYNVAPAWVDGDLARMLDLQERFREEQPAMQYRDPARRDALPADHLVKTHLVGGMGGNRLPRAVIYRDSFGERLVPHLAPYFSHAVYKWTSMGIDLRLVRKVKPDVVLQIGGARGLRAGVRYPSVIQWQMAARRFEATDRVMTQSDGENGFAGLKVLAGGPPEVLEGALKIRAPADGPLVLQLPALPEADTCLPVVRLDVTSSSRTWARVVWERKRPGDPGEHLRNYISAQLADGRDQVYIPIKDPEMTGPLRLEVGSANRHYAIHAIEIRGVPR